MSLELLSEQAFTVQATLAAADTTKTLKITAADERAVITSVILTSITAAAQTLFVGDESGTVKAISIAASLTANLQISCQLVRGLRLTVGEDLIIKPAAAGPAVHVVAEGWIEKA